MVDASAYPWSAIANLNNSIGWIVHSSRLRGKIRY